MALAGAALVAAPRPAAADEVQSLEAQAASIAHNLVLEQLQVDAYQQQYSVASAKVAADEQSITDVGQELGQDQQQVAADTSAVRQLAVKSYMEGGQDLSSPGMLQFAGAPESDQAASEYIGIAASNFQTALDQLHQAEMGLQREQVSLDALETEDRSTQERQATYLADANTTAAHLAALQAEVTGQLTEAVAQQDAAQAAAAAAAVVVHTAPPPPTATVTGPASAAPSGVSDPALNGFLQCVVQAESGGDYGAVSPNGMYMGAFQFAQATWNMAAQAAGLSSLVGVPPDRASKADQDTVAVALYSLDGEQPWLGDRCSR